MARVQLQSQWIGENVYHPAGAHAELRNTTMAAKSGEDWFNTLEWLYGDQQNNAGERLQPSAAAQPRALQTAAA